MFSAPTILLLEDEQAIADTILYAFETDGYSVKHVSTCGEALVLLREEAFDFAIFDVGLPDGTGFDLCKEVRTFSQVPVLFLTARADEIDRVVGLEIGGDDYVTKPFSPRELVARVKAILRRSIGGAASNHRVSEGELRCDEAACQFYFHNQVVDLTRTEYQLLCALYEQPGRVFTRDQLLDKISIDDGAAMDRVIDAHVKAIRAKLSVIATEGKEMVETRRGLGYALKVV